MHHYQSKVILRHTHISFLCPPPPPPPPSLVCGIQHREQSSNGGQGTGICVCICSLICVCIYSLASLFAILTHNILRMQLLSTNALQCMLIWLVTQLVKKGKLQLVNFPFYFPCISLIICITACKIWMLTICKWRSGVCGGCIAGIENNHKWGAAAIANCVSQFWNF